MYTVRWGKKDEHCSLVIDYRSIDLLKIRSILTCTIHSTMYNRQYFLVILYQFNDILLNEK